MPPFREESARYIQDREKLMHGVSGMESVLVPEGWHKESLFGRLVTRGVCSIMELHSPSTTMKALFSGLRMLDLEDYFNLKLREKNRVFHDS